MSNETDSPNSLKLVRPMTQGELKTRDSFLQSVGKGAVAFGAIALLATPFRNRIGAYLAKDTKGMGQMFTRLFTGIDTKAGVVNSATSAIANTVAIGAFSGGVDYVGTVAADAITGKKSVGPQTQRILEQQSTRQNIQR